MANTAAKVVIIASLAATTGLLINTKTPELQAILTVPMAAWLLFQFRSREKAWDNIGLFQNPVLFSINAFSASFIYLSWRTVPLDKAFYMSFGVFLLGGVASTMMHKYWNIGG